MRTNNGAPHRDDDDHIHPQLRLKCIVLGSAGAGKTSLLRRFAHGTFEGGPTTTTTTNGGSGGGGGGGALFLVTVITNTGG